MNFKFFVDGAQPILHRTVEDETPEQNLFRST
jgi:hypothetical protein